MDIPYIITDNNIQLTFDGKTRVIKKEEERYDEVISAIREERWEDVKEISTRQDENVNKILEAGLEVEGGFVKIDGCAVDGDLCSKILQFIEEGLPVKRLVKFYRKLQKNPSFKIRRDLYAFINKTGHPITEDGCFIAYKRVRENFKDCHTGTMDNSIGRIVKMDRNMVDDDPNNTCSSGLHVANYNYANNFYSNGVLLDVKVSPEDVVSIPTDYNNEKMRCCEYEVLAVSGGLREELSTDLYDEDDEEWDDEWDHEWDTNEDDVDDIDLEHTDLTIVEERGFSRGYDDFKISQRGDWGEGYDDYLPEDLEPYRDDEDVVSTWEEAYAEGWEEAKAEYEITSLRTEEQLKSIEQDGYITGQYHFNRGDVYNPTPTRGWNIEGAYEKWESGYNRGWVEAEDIHRNNNFHGD